MLSAVITVLLLGVMLLIIASLILSALHEHRRHLSVAIRTQAPTHPLSAHVGMILHMQDGAIVSVEKPESLPTFTLPSTWYARRRTFVSVSFLPRSSLA